METSQQKNNDADQPFDRRKVTLPITLIFFSIAALFFFWNLSDSDKQYLQTEGLAFGTMYHITYSHPDRKDLTQNIRNALATIDNSLSMFNKESTLSKINNNEAVGADDLLARVWAKGQEISAATDGAFDMTVAPLVDLWGFGLKNRNTVDTPSVLAAKEHVGYTKISISGHGCSKLDSLVRLDAGAIAKGFACDVVADTLAACGCTDICVEIGGEVKVVGLNKEGEAWRIGINKPVEDSLSLNNELQDIAQLTDCGMATSGNYRNFYEDGGRKISHTIDPRSGFPVRHSLLSATIVAADCMSADAWATACMVVGEEQAKRLIKNNNIEGYLIYHDTNGRMTTWYSEGFPLKNRHQ